MIRVLKNRTYAAMFSAQLIALLGTGLLTVALGLLAFELAGANAGAVLGTAYAIKMIAYVGLSPIASALVERLPRKKVLIAADIVRATVALALPFIDAVWQIYALIFVLQSASATFSPAFQATIPDILEDETDYTNALSLSRLAYDLENLLSPMLAAALLLVISFHWLFLGTVFGFLASAGLVMLVTLPPVSITKSRPFSERLTRGARIYLATPRLRGLLGLTLTAASASAFVIVNTVVMVRAGYGLGAAQVAYAMAAYGGGSMLAAFALPRVLDRISDRKVMMSAGVALSVLTIGHGVTIWISGLLDWSLFLGAWGLAGFFYASILTPSGRLLRKSAHPQDRPSVFAAQFALSHACWLITYPIAGFVGASFGLAQAMTGLGGVAMFGVILAHRVWPAQEPAVLDHEHPDLSRDHPHFQDQQNSTQKHTHAFVIDDEHPVWPPKG